MFWRAFSAVAALVFVASWPAIAGSDNPMAGIESSGSSGLVGLAVLVVAYGIWRLIVAGELFSLLSTVLRFLAFVYIPLLVFLALEMLSTMGMRSFGVDKEASAWISMVLAAAAVWIGFGIWSGRGSGPGK